jgi:hypothetical protein
MNNPAMIAAPPIPTTTPMTVFFVLVVMPEDEVFCSLDNEPVEPVAEGVEVEEETVVMVLPDSVMTDVKYSTVADVLTSWVAEGEVVVSWLLLLLLAEVVLDVLSVVLVGVFEGVDVVAGGVEVGVVDAGVEEGVELGVLLGVADVGGVDEGVEDGVDDAGVDEGVELTGVEAASLTPVLVFDETAEASIPFLSRPKILALNQFACASAKRRVKTVRSRNWRRGNMVMVLLQS